jgi:hypothetical protein
VASIPGEGALDIVACTLAEEVHPGEPQEVVQTEASARVGPGGVGRHQGELEEGPRDEHLRMMKRLVNRDEYNDPYETLTAQKARMNTKTGGGRCSGRFGGAADLKLHTPSFTFDTRLKTGEVEIPEIEHDGIRNSFQGLAQRRRIATEVVLRLMQPGKTLARLSHQKSFSNPES